MEDEKPRGISTKDRLTNDPGSVRMPCPECGHKINRSKKSRINAIKYTCPECGFEGPN